MTNNFANLIPVSKWNDYYNFPSVGSLRQLIFFNTDKFNDIVIRTLGKRKYIDTDAFKQWIEETNRKQAV